MRRWLLVLLVCSLVACGGGGSSALPGAKAPVTPLGQTQARTTITIPKASGSTSSARGPQFVSPGTQSVAISIASIDGVSSSPAPTPTVVSLTPANPNCTVVETGLQCSVNFTVPVATAVVLSITSYSSTDGTTGVLGLAFTPPVDTTQPNPQFTVSLGGLPAYVEVDAPAIAGTNDGTTQTVTFHVSAKDVSGATILPPGNYVSPISVAITGDTNGALSLSTSEIAAPGDAAGQTAVTVTYHSSIALASATITASAGAATNAALTFNVLTYSPTNLSGLVVGGLDATVTVSESNFSGTFGVAGLGPAATTSCVPADCKPATVGGAVAITVHPVQAATPGSFTISDDLVDGAKATLPFDITGPTGGSVTIGPYPVLEYTLPGGNSHPWGISIGDGGNNVWFTDQGSGSVGKIVTSSCGTAPSSCSIGDEPIPEESPGVEPNPAGIALGPDGNIWVARKGDGSFFDHGGVSIVSTNSPAGCASVPGSLNCTITAAPLPDFTPAPTAVIDGGDGQMYYTAPTNGGSYAQIGAIPIANIGGIGETQIGASGASPYQLVLGPDHNVWFTDRGTPTGVGTVSCASSCSSEEHPFISGGTPGGIAVGSDNNLWVTDSQGDRIIKFDPNACDVTCSFVVVAQLAAGSNPQFITLGPDGNMWFTEAGTNKIGVILTASCSPPCTPAELAIPTANAQPEQIILGPDGNIWFTEYGAGQIGKVVL
jgi:streptogramin lyase